jgi:2-oxo-hept-3-ene-1,7-dioate hydratase
MAPADAAVDPASIAAAVSALDRAEQTRQQIGQFSLAHPGMTIADAYAIQRAWVELKVGRGRQIRGHKIGLTSRAMQQSSQIEEPDYGVLLDDMFFAGGGDIPFRRFIVPRVEVELAFVLGKRLAGPHCTLEDALGATRYVVPAVEIIDARIEQLDRRSGAPRRVVDTISDNAANAGVVLGASRVKPRDVDLRWVAALLYRNEVIEESGVAAAVLDHPGNGIAWLANKLFVHDVVLDAGEVVLSGSFTRPVAARPGDDFRADYGPLGVISFRFDNTAS